MLGCHLNEIVVHEELHQRLSFTDKSVENRLENSIAAGDVISPNHVPFLNLLNILQSIRRQYFCPSNEALEASFIRILQVQIIVHVVCLIKHQGQNCEVEIFPK